MNGHFTFFESYYAAVKDLDNDLKAEFFDTLFQYALYEKEPDEATSPLVNALFLMAKPNLDNSKAKREAGKRGGSKPKQSGSKTEANESKEEANESKPKQSGSDKEKEKEKESKKGANKFVPPTLQEVINYQKDKCNLVDAKYFYEFFDTSGWVDSNGKKVANWKQKMITWQKTETTKAANNPIQAKKKEDFLI